MFNKLKNQKGFTLVELVVVMAIIGILVTIAVPMFSSSTNSAKDSKLKADLRSTDSALALIYAKNSAYPATQAAYDTAIAGYFAGGAPKDTAGTVFTYTLNSATEYTLTGVDTAGTTVKSPGSKP